MAGDRDKRPIQARDELAAKRFEYRRRKKARLLAVAILVVVTLVFAIWSVVFILTSDKEATRLSFLTKGSVDQSLTVSLAFLGEGQDIMAPGSGIVLPLVDEGDRVARDAEIALLVPSDRASQIQRYKDLKEAYDARLFVVSGFADLARNPQALSPADSRLRESIKAVIEAGDPGEMTKALKTFASLFPRSRTESALFARDDLELGRLALELEALLVLFKSDQGTRLVRAPITGLVSFRLPSFSSSYEDIKADPLAQIEVLASRSYLPSDLRYQRVQAGGVLASIQRFSGRTLAAFIPGWEEDQTAFRKGSQLGLAREADDLDWQGCVIDGLDPLKEGLLLRLSYEDWSGYQPTYLAYKDAQLQVKGQAGLRLPLTSLMDLDLEAGKARLMKVTGGVTASLDVRILASDGRYAIIEAAEESTRGLSESDLYVVNPWTTKEGILID